MPVKVPISEKVSERKLNMVPEPAEELLICFRDPFGHYLISSMLVFPFVDKTEFLKIRFILPSVPSLLPPETHSPTPTSASSMLLLAG